MILRRLFSTKPDRAEALYAAIVAAARQPVFYRDWAVPDTVDGRFDLLVLHLALVVARLHGEDDALRQDLVNRFCQDMDDNVRELGAGDLGVAKKVRRMAEAFQGRYVAYHAALDLEAMTQAVARNIYAGEAPSPNLASYALRMRANLAGQTTEEIVSGKPKFA